MDSAEMATASSISSNLNSICAQLHQLSHDVTKQLSARTCGCPHKVDCRYNIRSLMQQNIDQCAQNLKRTFEQHQTDSNYGAIQEGQQKTSVTTNDQVKINKPDILMLSILAMDNDDSSDEAQVDSQTQPATPPNQIVTVTKFDQFVTPRKVHEPQFTCKWPHCSHSTSKRYNMHVHICVKHLRIPKTVKDRNKVGMNEDDVQAKVNQFIEKIPKAQ